MALNTASILVAADHVLTAHDQEVVAGRARRPLLVACQTATGNADIDQTFKLDRAFRLVFVRCHFAGAAGRSALVISVDAAAGASFDCDLFTINRAGVGRDVNFRLSADEAAEPSAWTFQAGDALRVRWTNPSPGSMTWGVEVGMAPSS